MVADNEMGTEDSKPTSQRFRNLARWLAARLEIIVAHLKDYASPADTVSEFVDLAPIDEADPHGIYSRALRVAITNPNVSNIALTGPYGSGKSSIIRTFLKKHACSPLHISLAAFLPEADGTDPKEDATKSPKIDEKKYTVSKQEIERSILQQLLYGADSEKLPLSRFRRIKSPGFSSKLLSLYILLGFMALWYVFAQHSAIISGAYFKPLEPRNWLKFTMFAFAAFFIATTVHYFYVASFGVSLKSISLKNVELGPASTDESSILNRHLDEIIYFFQKTDYDLVVVEDLDRFNEPDIFVTLREINSLVNGNGGVKRQVRFLYALRDDMFVNTDRTKFFEFIIPVIPIINSSNAIDMVLKQGKRLALEDRLDQQFLREVSRYLNDLRLISNIFNEYAIYVANLETDGENSLNPNKLLAVLIYKNSYPRDFERLHRGEGRLASLFEQREALIEDAERAHRMEIVQLEQEIEAAERQVPKDVQDLRRLYAMALIQRLPSPVWRVGMDRQSLVNIPQLTEDDGFDSIIAAQSVAFQSSPQHGLSQLDISNLQSDVDPTATYRDRMASIEKKSQESKEAAQQRIRELREKIKVVRTSKFNVLLRNDSDRLTEAFAQLGDGGDLARFLLLEGHLDDSYYQYTSMFHSGRLSPNDNKFLRQIRSFVTPAPDFPIDNAGEIIENMREEDFGLSYVLNVKLVDALLGDPEQHDRTAKLFRFLATEFSERQEFFQAYYSTGAHTEQLLVGLSASWQRFIPAVLESSMRDTHLARLIEHAPTEVLGQLADEYPRLSEYLAEALPNILSHVEGLDPSKLEPLAIQLQKLSAIEKHPQIVRALFEDGHYRLSLENLDFIHESILGRSDVEDSHRRHFSSLRESGSRPLLDRVGEEFQVYFENVLSQLEGNDDEDLSALLELLSHGELDAGMVETFIAKQKAVFPSFDAVPDRYRSSLFSLAKIEPNWENCLAFLREDTFNADSLIEFLTDENVRSALLETSIPAGEDAMSLRHFLRGANGMADQVYREYIVALPKMAKSFPKDLEVAKRRIMIEERGVTFTADNLASLDEDANLQILFVAKNIGSYLNDPAGFSVDDDFREQLLRTEITDDEKRSVIGLMDLSLLADRPERAALVAQILARTNTNLQAITFETAQAIILASIPTPMRVKLFNELHRMMDVPQVRETLKRLPGPYNDITTGYGRPQLSNSEENRALAEWLDRRNVISSFTKAWWSDDIVVHLYRK